MFIQKTNEEEANTIWLPAIKKASMDKRTMNLIEYAKLQHSQRVQNLVLANRSSDNTQSKAILAKALPSTQPLPGAIIRIVPNNYKRVVQVESATNHARSKVQKNSPEKRSVNTALASTSTEFPRVEKVEVSSNCSNDNYDDQFEEFSSNDSTFFESTATLPVQQNKRPKVNILKRKLDDLATLPQITTKKTHNGNCCSCCRETLETILQQQQEIISLLKDSKLSNSVLPVANKLDLLPQMPFTDINDFLDFDESLTNDNVQYQFMIKLKKLLVSTEQKSVANIMSAILTNELCKSISWIGVKDTIPFGTSNMVNPIVDVIQAHHLINIDVVKGRIAEWLRRCGDRINNEIKRRQKKIEQGYSIEMK